MPFNKLSYRMADAYDMEIVSRIITDVSDGIVETLVQGTFRTIDAREAIAWVISHGAGCYNIKNVILIGGDAGPAGLLFAYPASEHGIPGAAEWYIKRKVRERLRDVLSASYPDSLHVNTLWVSPESRGKGLGVELLRFAEDLSRQKGLRGVGLFVWADNVQALNFYESQGYRKARSVHPGEPPICGKNGPHTEGGFLMFKP